MAAVRFYPQVAVYSETGELAEAGQRGIIVYPGTQDAATISEDRGGTIMIPGAEMVVSSIGLIPGFWLQGEEIEVEWLAQDLSTRIPIFSPVGLLEAAQEARDAALAAQAAAEAAAQAAQEAVTSERIETIWVGTATGYDEVTPNPNTLYLISEG